MYEDAIGRSDMASTSGEQLEEDLQGHKSIERQATNQANTSNIADQQQLKVLVIEDEENIIELIKLGLRYEGFQVESASDGLQGVSAAQRIDPDMVILDLGLP